MSVTITKPSEIPAAPFYVVSNDTFMSYWGKADNRINTVILPCESYTEALAVAEYAESRGDQKYIRINSHKPRLNNQTHLYSLMRREHSAWYPE